MREAGTERISVFNARLSPWQCKWSPFVALLNDNRSLEIKGILGALNTIID
jgi:hypothetical protein